MKRIHHAVLDLLICHCAFPEPDRDGGHDDDDGHDYPASDDQVIVHFANLVGDFFPSTSWQEHY